MSQAYQQSSENDPQEECVCCEDRPLRKINILRNGREVLQVGLRGDGKMQATVETKGRKVHKVFSQLHQTDREVNKDKNVNVYLDLSTSLQVIFKKIDSEDF